MKQLSNVESSTVWVRSQVCQLQKPGSAAVMTCSYQEATVYLHWLGNCFIVPGSFLTFTVQIVLPSNQKSSFKTQLF